MEILNLNKGDILNLSKTAPNLQNVNIGLGWDTKCDLDSIAFLTDKEGVIRDMIYFGDKKKQGIFLNGDNLTGEGDGDDEIISVDFSKLPDWVYKIQICVNIFSFIFRTKDFSQIKGSYVRLINANTNAELCRYNLNENGKGFDAFHFANLNRTENGWDFETIGQGLNGSVGKLKKTLTK